MYLISNMKESIANHPERKAQIERMMLPFVVNMQEESGLIREDINKVTFMGARLPFEEIRERFKEDFHIIPGSYSQDGTVCG